MERLFGKRPLLRLLDRRAKLTMDLLLKHKLAETLGS
jgi:hypothetical protein